MKIAVIGATGNVGQRIVAEAESRGHEVVAISRSGHEVGNGRAVQADLTDKAGIASAIEGADAVVLSVRFRDLDVEALLDALKGAKRLLIVGGAASLYVAPGVQLIDTEGFPDFIKVEAEPARQALARIQRETTLTGPSSALGLLRAGRADGDLPAGQGRTADRRRRQEPYQLRGLRHRPARRDRAAKALAPAFHDRLLRRKSARAGLQRM